MYDRYRSRLLGKLSSVGFLTELGETIQCEAADIFTANEDTEEAERVAQWSNSTAGRSPIAYCFSTYSMSCSLSHKRFENQHTTSFISHASRSMFSSSLFSTCLSSPISINW